MSASIGFYGGVGSVTGANFLLKTETQSIVIDCGLVQGDSFVHEENAQDFPYDPSACSALFVTHAHADHIGRIPKLIRDGFRGVIYSTSPTRALAEVMLMDAYTIMQAEAHGRNMPLLYDRADIAQTLALWKTVAYHDRVSLQDGVEAHFRSAGHILGSATVTFTRGRKSVLFSGDIGNVPQPLLDPPEYPTEVAYMVIESVYGDRVHEDVARRTELLRTHIEHTIKTKGVLLIPAFSIERTQAMLLEINNLVESGAIPAIPTFLDSPLAITVTDIYRQFPEYLSQSLQEQIRHGDDIFQFNKLTLSHSAESSAEIEHVSNPKIIIAGSGMSHGGRIRTHEKHYLDDPNTTLLLVGYQTVGSIGRLLQDGAREVSIDKERVKVRARIETIRGYSGHADRDGLLSFIESTHGSLKQIFVTMGEEKASLFLVQRIRDYLSLPAEAPEEGAVRDIDW